MNAILQKFLQVPLLTPGRIRAAMFVAAAADGLQWALAALLGPGILSPIDDILDVAVMLVLARLLGFHLLLLPSFLLEVMPVADLLPTWVGCTLLIIASRKKEQNYGEQPNDPPPPAQT